MKDYFHRMNHPSMLQIRYLEELEKAPKKRGIISTVAQRCGVDHAAVSRFIKNCQTAGYVNKKYELTQDGLIWLHAYQRVRQGLREYLISSGISAKRLDRNVAAMMENMDYHTLNILVTNYQNHRLLSPYKELDKYQANQVNLADFLERTTYQVHFRVLRIDRLGAAGHELSMADPAFLKPAVLRNYKRGVWMEIGLREIRAWSRVQEEWITGKLSSLKYEQHGLIRQAKIQDNKVRIPLEYCHVEQYDDSKIYGAVPITVASDVGTQHMPESTALLVFWM